MKEQVCGAYDRFTLGSGGWVSLDDLEIPPGHVCTYKVEVDSVATGSSWLSEVHVKRPKEKEEIINDRLVADLVWTNPEKSGNTHFNQMPLLGAHCDQETNNC